MLNTLFFRIIFTVLLVFSADNILAQDKKRVTVLNFYADNLPESYARITRNSLEVSLYNKGNQFQLLERAQVKMIFDELKIRGDECKETSCLVDVGKTLSADFALSGSIAMLDEYRIVIKLISIANAEIAAVYSRDFDSEDEIDSVIDKITDKIIEDIPYYSQHNTTIRPVEPPWYEPYRQTLMEGTAKIWGAFASFWTSLEYDIYGGFNYFLPAGKLADIVNPGCGFTLEAGAGNFLTQGLSLGLSAGAVRFSGKENVDDLCYFFPVQLAAGYKFDVLRDLSLRLVISAGFNHIYMKHAEGGGFDMENNTDKRGYDPVAEAGLDAEYRLKKNLSIVTGARFGTMYEKDGNLYFVNGRLGTKYKF